MVHTSSVEASVSCQSLSTRLPLRITDHGWSMVTPCQACGPFHWGLTTTARTDQWIPIISLPDQWKSLLETSLTVTTLTLGLNQCRVQLVEQIRQVWIHQNQVTSCPGLSHSQLPSWPESLLSRSDQSAYGRAPLSALPDH